MKNVIKYKVVKSYKIEGRNKVIKMKEENCNKTKGRKGLENKLR